MKLSWDLSISGGQFGLGFVITTLPPEVTQRIGNRSSKVFKVRYSVLAIVAVTFVVFEMTLYNERYETMSDEKPKKPGPIVEDETRVGGIDENGAATIGNKTPDGRADESIEPTDQREKPDKKD